MSKSTNNQQWFEIIKYKDYLYVIRERLDEIDPRYLTTYTNLYLLIGTHSALLIDTACGIFPIKPVIEDLILDKNLIVINTHSHFDHIGGNSEFDTILIHKKESRLISKSRDISFLSSSPKKVVRRLEIIDYIFSPAKKVQPVEHDEIIDLGELSVRVIHTPGHSPGCISLLTSRNELFTGDTAYYGTIYLTKSTFPISLNSIANLLNLFQEFENIDIYPSHEDFAVGKELLEELTVGIQNIDDLWDSRIRVDSLNAWLIKDKKFKYIVF